MKHTHLPAADIEPRPRYTQRAESQSVSKTSCMARKAGYRDKTLRINTLHERALKAFRSAGLREDESERALNERDQNTGGKARRTGLEGAVGEAMRAFRHTTPSRKAHLSCLQTTQRHLSALSLLEASLNTGPQKTIFCAWAVPSRKSRVFMDGNSFYTSRPRFRPFSWIGNRQGYIGSRLNPNPSTI